MKPPTIAWMICLFVSISFPRVPAGESLPAQGPNASGAVCLSYEPSVVELTGTITRKTSPDALNRPEKYWVIELPQPICVNEDPKEPDLNYAQKDVRAIQLVFLNQKMYATYKDLLGKKVIEKGALFAGITAHHHTSVLLTVGTLRMAN
jgi:hypothetical protein